jgi:predicted MFS family arabinose efflux permease
MRLLYARGEPLCSHRADARQRRHRLLGAGASASVSLNTSALYIGQASGSAIGGFLYARDLFYASGYVATALVAQAVIAMILTKPTKGRGA